MDKWHKSGSLELESRFDFSLQSPATDGSGLLLLAAHSLAALMAKRPTIIDAPFIIFPLPIEFHLEGG